jgi:hypothetical protein
MLASSQHLYVELRHMQQSCIALWNCPTTQTPALLLMKESRFVAATDHLSIRLKWAFGDWHLHSANPITHTKRAYQLGEESTVTCEKVETVRMGRLLKSS